MINLQYSTMIKLIHFYIFTHSPFHCIAEECIHLLGNTYVNIYLYCICVIYLCVALSFRSIASSMRNLSLLNNSCNLIKQAGCMRECMRDLFIRPIYRR